MLASVHAVSVEELAVPPAFLANAFIQYLVLGDRVAVIGANAMLFVDTNIPRSCIVDPLLVMDGVADSTNFLEKPPPGPTIKVCDADCPLLEIKTVTCVENVDGVDSPVPTEFMAKDLNS